MTKTIRIYDEDYKILKLLAKVEKRGIAHQISVLISFYAPKPSKELMEKTLKKVLTQK